jgi:hypothetical protein
VHCNNDDDDDDESIYAKLTTTVPSLRLSMLLPREDPGVDTALAMLAAVSGAHS